MTDLNEALALSLIRDAERGDGVALQGLPAYIPAALAGDACRFVLRVLRDPRFVAAQASSRFLGWVSISLIGLRDGRSPLSSDCPSDALGQIVDSLEWGFATYADGYSKYLVGVILGEQVADARSLAALLRLADGAGAEDRDEVAHALQHLAVDAPDSQVRAAGEARLRRMTKDRDTRVRASATAYVAQVEKGIAI